MLVISQGGGWCNNIRTCVYRKTTRRGSSNYMEKQIPFTGILSNKAEENPGFSFNFVLAYSQIAWLGLDLLLQKWALCFWCSTDLILIFEPFCSQIFSIGIEWSFAIVTVHLSWVKVKTRLAGIFSCTFQLSWNTSVHRCHLPFKSSIEICVLLFLLSDGLFAPWWITIK